MIRGMRHSGCDEDSSMTSHERVRHWTHSSDTATLPDQGRKMKTLRVLVLAPIALLTFFFGGARPWIWQSVAGLFFICLGAWLLRHGPPAPGKDMKRLLTLACALVLAPLAQTIPLPAALLETLSPVRAQWSRALFQFGDIAGTTLSYDPLATWTHLAWWCFLIVFAALLSQALNFSRGTVPTWFLRFLFALAGAQAMYGIMQTLLPFLGVLWDTHAATGRAYGGYARGTFINRNHFAAFLGLIWPVLLAYLLVLKPSRTMEQTLGKREQAQILLQKKVFGIFFLALIILALLFSQSRGGILSAVLSFTLLSIFSGLRRKRVAVALAACWLITLGYGAMIGFDGLQSRFLQMEHSAAGRVELWKDGWKAVLDHPLTGTGLGTYPEVGRAYQNAFTPEQRASHAHNDYLETAVELGLPAAAVLIAGIWGLWCRRAALLWRARTTMDPDRLLLAAASLAALGGYLLHGWVEFNNAIPANQLTALIIATFHIHIAEQGNFPKCATPLQSADA
jgi:O-antigen ligase